jgi:hypothetical protein
MEIEADDEVKTDDWISAGADYSPKAEFKIAILAMEAVRNCCIARGKEMKQGFWNNKVDKNGNAVKIWIEDQRKVFINSVIALENLLSAECLADTSYNKFIKGEKDSLNSKLKVLFEKYAYNIFEFDNTSGGWKKTNKTFMPQIDAELLVPSPHDARMLVNISGGWDYKVNAYYDELVPLYDELFKELRNVIFRIKDFKKKHVIG